MAVALLLLVLLLSCHICAGVGMCASLVRFSKKEKNQEKTYCSVALQTELTSPEMTTVLVQQPDGDFFVSAL